MNYEQKAKKIREIVAGDLGVTYTMIADRLGLTKSAVSQAVNPGKLEAICDRILEVID